jgi:hypothetical protein
MSGGAGTRAPRSSKQRAIDAAATIGAASISKLMAEACDEYEQATDRLLFTKDFNEAVEARMHDPLNTNIVRVEAWIRRHSHGKFSLWAIRDDGTCRLQIDCANELGLDKRAVSKSVAYLQKRGYVLEHPKRLMPALAPILSHPDLVTATTKEWATFVEEWRVANSADFGRLEVARSVVKEVRKVMREEFKRRQKSKVSETNADASLLRLQVDNQLENAGSPGLTPFQIDSRRKGAKKTQPENSSVEGGVQSNPQLERQIAALLKHKNELLDQINRVLDCRISADTQELEAQEAQLQSQLETTDQELGILQGQQRRKSTRKAEARAAIEAARSEAQDRLFTEIAQMQRTFAGTSFADTPIDRDNPDHLNLIRLILDKLGQYDDNYLMGYFMLLVMKFKGIGPGGQRRKPRAPGQSTGPEGLGLLVHWAEDYARIERDREQDPGV